MDAGRRRLISAVAVPLAGLGAIGLAAALSACQSLASRNPLTLSERELQALVQRAFPVQRNLLEVFDASIGTPRLRLLPESNRLGAKLDVALRDRFVGSRWQGALDFDSLLAWQAEDQTLRLRQVRVHDLQFVSADAASRSRLERLGAALAERVLENLQIYKLPAERAAQLQRMGRSPGSVTVTPRGVEVLLTPAG